MFFNRHEIDAFWDRLAPHWNRRPVVIKRPFLKPFIDQSEFFGFLQAWARETRDGKRAFDVEMIDADVLPRSEDRTLAEFEARIAPRWNRPWYLYVSDGLHHYDGAFWERAVELIEPALRRQGGVPSGGMTLEVFYGKYGSTPTGIHLDSSDNIAFVARGPKRLLFWPPDRFTARLVSPPQIPRHQQCLTGRYEEFLSDALVIDADEGDVIYWPKEYWHVGASGGDWSGMVSMPMWWSASPSKLAHAMVARLLDLRAEPRPYALNLDDMVTAAGTLPPALGDMVGQVKSQINSRLDLTVRIGWAKFVSGYGFSTPPAPQKAPQIAEDTRIRVKHPVVSIDLGRAAAIIACGQNVLTHCKPLTSVVAELRPGSEHTVSDLASHLPDGDGAREHLCPLVADLVSFRALEIV
jgi:hypothetical protein